MQPGPISQSSGLQAGSPGLGENDPPDGADDFDSLRHASKATGRAVAFDQVEEQFHGLGSCDCRRCTLALVTARHGRRKTQDKAAAGRQGSL